MEHKSDAKWHPQRLDVRAFSRDGSVLSGQAPLEQWERLTEESEDGLVSPPVKWQARGEAVSEAGEIVNGSGCWAVCGCSDPEYTFSFLIC